ncbi:MAG: hypothetical protein AB7G48_06950 [Nitrospiraceae bacterium]
MVLMKQAMLKGAELALMNLLRPQTNTTVPQEMFAPAAQEVERIRSRMTCANVLGYFNARQIPTPPEQQHVHATDTLKNSRQGGL